MARDENHRLAIAENSSCDRTYKRMFRAYCQFVDRQIDQGVLVQHGPTYFTGQYIDHFLTVVIANGSHLSPNYAKKFMYALDWFALRDPHTRGQIPVQGRPAVMEALQIQKWAHRRNAAVVGKGANAQQRLLLDMQARFEQLEERERQREYRERQREQQFLGVGSACIGPPLISATY